jgi:subtilisin family serine protease
MPRGRVCVAAVLAVASVPAAAGGAAAAPVPSGPAASRPAGTAGAAVTLITGDRVRLFRAPDGRPAVGVQPGPGRERTGFVRSARRGRDGEHVSVIPADAVPLLAAGRLDPRLFDVTALTAAGLAGRPALPLILGYARGAARTAPPAAAARLVRALPSIGAAAVQADTGGRLWSWLTDPRRGGAPRSLAGGVGTVWLDALARPAAGGGTTPATAPAAAATGPTGAGVTVAVLGTGIRADHPDLAGKVVQARDFTGTSPAGGDDIGAGTHAAGLIAGTGAASAGRFRGVAPDARLLDGKVCVDFGCPTSAVIAGMEWAAPLVPVVDLAVVAAGSDGTDPLSRSVDALSAAYGTLFVAPAGADDPTEGIAAPAAADAALAVGSVGAGDQTSVFSPRGPRRGDDAVKPDLAAPGEAVVAARAAGTPAGDADPVDGDYARMSGTATAAAQVAGAAALLREQHPDWAADRLKAALMSTAAPTGSVYEQGAGRLDTARAVSQPVTATGSLSYGFFGWPHHGPATRTVTYRNDGPAPVTLDLAVTAAGPPAPAGLFTAATDRVTVPAHGTAAVPVTADPDAGGPGTAGPFGARLTATAAGTAPGTAAGTAAGPGIAVQTALGAVVEPESYDLRLHLVSRTGHFDAGLAQLVDTATGAVFGAGSFDATGTAVVRLPRGSYDVNALDLDDDPANPAAPLAVTLLSAPGVPLTADRTVRLDARAAAPVRVRVDQPAATLQFGELGIVSGDAAGTSAGSLSWFARPGQQLFAGPTGRAVTDHTYTFFFRATLAAAPPAQTAAQTVYQLAFLRRGGIPAPAFRVRDRELARVDARYHGQGVPANSVRADFALLPVPNTGAGVFETYPLPIPLRRTEFYTPGPDVSWEQLLGVAAPDLSDVEVHWSFPTYRPGPAAAGWDRAPLGPAFGVPSQGWAVGRAGDQLAVAVPLLSGSDPAQYTAPPAAETGTTTLSRDGVELGSSPAPCLGAVPMPPGAGRYTLRCTAARVVPWSVLATAADVSWTFTDPGAAAPATPGLFVLRARGQVDDMDRAPAVAAYPLALTVQRLPGAAASRLTALRVEMSTDDGASWRAVPTGYGAGGGVAVLRQPAAGFVSLRITAADAAGDTVTQTALRAYQVAG